MCLFLRSFVQIFPARPSVRAIAVRWAAVWAWVLMAGCLLASCNGLQGIGSVPASSGRPYELLVVAEKGVWNAPAGQAVRRMLEADVPGLPQAEPSFRVMHAAPEDFDAVLRLVRNILVVEVDKDKHPQASFRFAKDAYASPQVIGYLGAPDEASLQAWVEKRQQSVARLFLRTERARAVQGLKESHSAGVLTQAREMFGCEVWVPAALKASKTGKDFLWVSTNAATDDRNFVMYSFPYASADVFTKAGFVHKRDSVMAVNIPGACPGMHMATDSLMTDVRRLRVRGTEVLEARGLWRMEGDFMGGPYVAHARLDTAQGRVVVAEVFVYAPGRPKRNLLRALEASLYTLRCPGEQRISNH